jgi:hypothetical protein
VEITRGSDRRWCAFRCVAVLAILVDDSVVGDSVVGAIAEVVAVTVGARQLSLECC